MNDRPHNPWAEVAAVLAVGVVPNLAACFTFSPGPAAPETAGSLAFYIVRNLCSAYVVFYLLSRTGEPWESFGVDRPRWSDVPYALLVAVISWTVWLVQVTVVPHLGAGPGNPPMPADRSPGWVSLIVAYDLANALSEEVTVRAYLLVRLAALLKSTEAAVVISAAAFASYHAYQGANGVVDNFAVGLVWGALFAWRKRLWAFVLGHAAYNLFLEFAVG